MESPNNNNNSNLNDNTPLSPDIDLLKEVSPNNPIKSEDEKNTSNVITENGKINIKKENKENKEKKKIKKKKGNKKGSLLVDNALSKHPPSKKVYLNECTDTDLENINKIVNDPNSLNTFEEIPNMGLLLFTDDKTKTLFTKKPLKPICYPKEINIDPHSVLENGKCYNDKNCGIGLTCEGNYGDYLEGKCVPSENNFTKIVMSSSHPCEKGSDCGIGYKCKEESGIFTSSKKCFKDNIDSTTKELVFYGVV
jgi:hypothetical protein